MSAPLSNVDTFYRERVPAQWNRTLERQARAAENDADARAQFEQMHGVEATIDVVVQVASDRTMERGERVYHLNISAGRMASGSQATQTPFITLLHDLDTFVTLERESGDSILGFLGALAGQPGDMKLTAGRLRNLRMLQGSARVELTGGAPMTLEARFGGTAGGAAQNCTLRIGHEAFAALRSGELAPQDAFMTGQVEIEGNMQLAMQLALAALSPE